MQETEFGELYLTCPEMFPARVSGEPAGTESLLIVFLGTMYRFRGLSNSQAEMLRERYGNLCRSAQEDGIEAVEIQVFRSNADDFIATDRRRYYTFDMRHEPGSVMVAGPNFMALIKRGPALPGGLWVSQADSQLEKLAFENYFRLLVSYRMLAQGGVLLHSAGVVHAGRACLFVGHSGAGKSTMARLSAERDKQVLSDDLNAFVKSEKGYVAGKLPFSGSFERNTLSASHYPVGFLGYLHKENYNIINHNQLSFAEMVSKLVANSPFVNADPYCEQQLFDNVAAILEEIHMATVTFDLSGNIWDELHSLIENRTAAVCVQ